MGTTTSTHWTEQLRLHEQAEALAPGLRREAIEAFSLAPLRQRVARAATRFLHSPARNQQRRIT